MKIVYVEVSEAECMMDNISSALSKLVSDIFNARPYKPNFSNCGDRVAEEEDKDE